MLYSEEQIQRANERSITEYFRQAGYSCKRVGSETHIEGFGGFYVNDTTIPNKFYIHSQQKGGVGLVNCLMKVMDMLFKEAVRAALDGELGQGGESIVFRIMLRISKSLSRLFPNRSPNS